VGPGKWGWKRGDGKKMTGEKRGRERGDEKEGTGKRGRERGEVKE
jgi:hypothetical protein